MASVPGSKLVFESSHNGPVNLILNDGTNTSDSTIAGSFNIEIFTTSLGKALPGVDATAFIEGAVKTSRNAVVAGSLSATEQLGTGAYKLIDDTGRRSSSQHTAPQGETIQLGTGAQTVVGSSGDTIVAGNSTGGRQVIDLTGANHRVTAGPMTAVGGAGALLVGAGTGDSIAGGAGPETVFGGGPATHNGRDDDNHGRGNGHSDDQHHGRGDNHGQGQGHDRGQGHDQGRGNGHDDGHGGAGGFGGNTISGGTGPMTVLGGRNDLITGGSGALTVREIPGASGGGDTIVGGSGTNLILDRHTSGHNMITGGTGTVTGAGGQAVNTFVVSDRGDTVTGSSGSLSVNGGMGHTTINAGLGGTTVDGGNRDVINNLGDGSLLVDIASRSKGSVRGGGMETVNLGAGHGATTLRDISVPGGNGHHGGSHPGGNLAETTVTGFSAVSDVIASATSVDKGGEFLGSSAVSGGNTVLTFIDGEKMTLVGITDLSKLNFTK